MNQKPNQELPNGEKMQTIEFTNPQLIKTDWFMTFPWLIHKNRLFRNNICVSAKTWNLFVSGKDDLVKHQGSTDH